jgi:hypothetical protein
MSVEEPQIPEGVWVAVASIAVPLTTVGVFAGAVTDVLQDVGKGDTPVLVVHP